MKHPWRVLLLIIGFFVFSQLFSLALFLLDIHQETIVVGNESINISYHPDTVMGSRPTQRDLGAIIYIVIALFISTLIALLILKMTRPAPWRLFMFLAFFTAISIALGVLLPRIIALLLGAIIALLLVKKPIPIIINLAHLLAIPGIVIVFAPMLSPLWALLLLIVISIYDYISVNITGHMIKLAKRSAKKLAVALVVPYKKDEWVSEIKSISISQKRPIAILGGGDLAFPALLLASFAEKAFNVLGSRLYAFLYSLPIMLGSVLGLVVLLILGSRNKFYPAMPLITLGATIGLIISFLLL